MSDLVWEEPPPPISGGTKATPKYAAIAEKLKARPGVWARIAVFARSSLVAAPMIAVRQGRSGFSPKGAFEATSRTIKSGQEGQKVIHLYARYVGGEDL